MTVVRYVSVVTWVDVKNSVAVVEAVAVDVCVVLARPVWVDVPVTTVCTSSVITVVMVVVLYFHQHAVDTYIDISRGAALTSLEIASCRQPTLGAPDSCCKREEQQVGWTGS